MAETIDRWRWGGNQSTWREALVVSFHMPHTKSPKIQAPTKTWTRTLALMAGMESRHVDHDTTCLFGENLCRWICFEKYNIYIIHIFRKKGGKKFNISLRLDIYDLVSFKFGLKDTTKLQSLRANIYILYFLKVTVGWERTYNLISVQNFQLVQMKYAVETCLASYQFHSSQYSRERTLLA